MQRGVRQQLDGAGGHAVEVVGVAQEPGLAVGDHLRQSAHPGSDHRDFAGHRLEGRDTEALLRRGQQTQVGDGQQGRHQLLLAQRIDVAGQAQVARPPTGQGQLGTVPHEQQARRDPFADAAKQLDHHAGPLHRPEVRDVNHQLRIRRPAPVARRQTGVGHAPVVAAVEEVGDDLDAGAHRKLAVGVVPQAAGDRGDAVRLVDGERDRLQIGRVAADQGDVGAVQRRDDPRDVAVARGGQDLPGEPGRGRVRHRVVRVDDVEPAFAADLDDLVGQRQQVLRLAEQRVAGRPHGVEGESRLEVAQPHRRLAADEPHLVAAPREPLGELRGDDAAAADGCVADDADVHEA